MSALIYRGVRKKNLASPTGSEMVGNGASTVKNAIDKINNTFASYSYFINAANNDIANVSLDGVTDDLAAMQSIFAHIKANDLRGVRVYVPNKGNPLRLSNHLKISVGFVILDLQCDVQFTKTVYAAESSPIIFTPLIAAEAPLRQVAVNGTGIKIDGNARNFTGLPADGYGSVSRSNCLTFFGCDVVSVKGIHAYNGIGFGIDLGWSRNGVIQSCEASYARFENGIGCNFFPYWQLDRDIDGVPLYETYDSSDPEWYCNHYVIDCVAHHNTDVGISAFSANGVWFKDCLSYENGNDGLSGEFNAGGGYSFESSHPYTVDKRLVGRTENCRAINNKNYSFFSDKKFDVRHINPVSSGVVSTSTDPAVILRRAADFKVMNATDSVVRVFNPYMGGSDYASLVIFGSADFEVVGGRCKDTESKLVQAWKNKRLSIKGVTFSNIGKVNPDATYNFIDVASDIRVGAFELIGCEFDDVGYGRVNKQLVAKIKGNTVITNFDSMNSGAYRDIIAVTDTTLAIATDNTAVYTKTASESVSLVRFYSTVDNGMMRRNDVVDCLEINQATNMIGNRSGTTASRPTGSALYEGFEWYDKTIQKQIWWNGTVWKDGTNTTV